MKAVGYRVAGAIDRPDALIDFDIPVPDPGPRDLRVKVMAVSVNPADAQMRAKRAPVGDVPAILGWDASGIVESIGSKVTLFKPGDEVFYAGDLRRSGTNAELHLVDERIVGSKPRSLSWSQSAAMPLTTLTAWELLFDRLGVSTREGEPGTLLVINGAGGVGSILIQLAAQLTGLQIIATASRPDTIAWVSRMGAHQVVDHHKPLDQQLKALGIPTVRYVAALTATERHIGAIAKCIAPQGRVAIIDDPKSLDIVPFKMKSVSVAWELMFTRSMFETADMGEQGRILNEASARFDSGALRSTLRDADGPIDAVHLKKVHAQIEGRKSYGKSVLTGF